jgi:hypothetical protein
MRDLLVDLQPVLGLLPVLHAELEQQRRQLRVHVAEHQVLDLRLHRCVGDRPPP